MNLAGRLKILNMRAKYRCLYEIRSLILGVTSHCLDSRNRHFPPIIPLGSLLHLETRLPVSCHVKQTLLKVLNCTASSPTFSFFAIFALMKGKQIKKKQKQTKSNQTNRITSSTFALFKKPSAGEWHGMTYLH